MAATTARRGREQRISTAVDKSFEDKWLTARTDPSLLGVMQTGVKPEAVWRCRFNGDANGANQRPEAVWRCRFDFPNAVVELEKYLGAKNHEASNFQL